MADPEHLRILNIGVQAFNEWRKKNYNIYSNLYEDHFFDVTFKDTSLLRADLSGADLSGADLSGADLSGADLSEADLSGANLSGADLSSADLSEADLSGANLYGADLSTVELSAADLSGADLLEANLSGSGLSGANLSGVNLRRADLSWVDLDGANLSGAEFGGTIIVGIDLSDVSGLENTDHSVPSTISIDTIFRSGGKIPHTFLEDTGVPDIFIKYMGSLTGQPFQFYSCFISYSSNDKEFAERLYADLRKESVRCWFAPEDIKGGKKLDLQLDEAIRIHDKLLLILSEESISSDWVANEIKRMRKGEKQEGKQKLFPVTLIDYEKLKDWELFDADTATDLAAEVRSYFIPDFTNWKDHDSYQQAFQRLLRDLQTEE